MRVTLNAGIGDLILSRAMLPADVEVALDYDAIDRYRTPAYREFADALFRSLFHGFTIVESDQSGMTPQEIAALGFKPGVPDLRPRRVVVAEDHTIVTTKVRGWHCDRYLAIRTAFLERISRMKKVILLGEREIGRNAEYDEHGYDNVYSIYEDLKPLADIDVTVPELGATPPSWQDFFEDCAMMSAAGRVVALGSGGNVTMAMAFASRCVLNVGGTEMEGFFNDMPSSPRVCRCTTDAAFLEALQ